MLAVLACNKLAGAANLVTTPIACKSCAAARLNAVAGCERDGAGKTKCTRAPARAALSRADQSSESGCSSDLRRGCRDSDVSRTDSRAVAISAAKGRAHSVCSVVFSNSVDPYACGMKGGAPGVLCWAFHSRKYFAKAGRAVGKATAIHSARSLAVRLRHDSAAWRKSSRMMACIVEAGR